jgi:hypothetical protein
MSGFTLRVYIYGLAALLKKRDGSRDVVLVQPGHDGHHPSNHSGCTRHYSFLAARSSSCSGTCLVDADASDKGFQGVWNSVNGLEISLQTPGGDPSTGGPVRDYRLDPPQDLQRPDPQHALVADSSWIFPLSELLPLRSNYRQNATSAMVLRGGTLSSCSLSTLRPPDISTESLKAPVFELRLNGSHRTQALADAAVWQRHFAGDRLEVQARPLGGGEISRTMVLKPYLPDHAGTPCIDLFYANLPRLYRDGHLCHEPQGDRRVSHFSMYYPLFDTSNLPDQDLRSVPAVVDSHPTVDGFPLTSQTLDGRALPLAEDIDKDLLNGATVSDKQACVIVQ